MLAMAFQFAPILWAGGAAAAPVIIHLIMRTKARKVKFPPIQFVRKTHRANISMHRLKHLILLLMRIAAIILITLLIARWAISDWRAVPLADEPSAVAIVVDNSGSMGYRWRDQTLLARGKEIAQRLIDSLPAGSRVAVLATSGGEGAVGFTSDFKRAGERVSGIEATYGHEPVAPAVRHAAGLLNNVTDLKSKNVFVISDMTAQSWREGSGAHLRDDADKRFFVVNLGVEDVNAGIGDLRLSAACVPVGADVAIRTEIRRPRQGPELSLSVEMDGKPVYQKMLDVPPGEILSLTLPVRPTAEGVAEGKVTLGGVAGQDPLEMDNQRHFTLLVGSAARLLAVRDRVTIGAQGPTSFLMERAVAPPGAEMSQGQWVSRVPVASDRLSAEELRGAAIVLLADVSSLAEVQWKALKAYVENGGKLWIVAGPLISAEAYNAADAQAVVPVEIGPLEQKAEGVGWAGGRAPASGGPRTQALLEPFASGENPSLDEVRCLRRFAIKSVADGAETVLRYSDGVPAAVWRDVGAGQVVFWNFSPARDFSNLARLKQFVVLTQRTLEMMLQRWNTAYFWSDAVTVAAPRWMAEPVVEVVPPAAAEGERKKLTAAKLTIPRVDLLGQWRVRFTESGRGSVVSTEDGPGSVLYGFSVNARYAESDLTAIKDQALREMFPPEQLWIVNDPSEIAQHSRGKIKQALDLSAPLLLALLLVVTAESFLANRFWPSAVRR